MLVQQSYSPKGIDDHRPCLDKVYADSCSKSTKQLNRALGHIQTLTLDSVGSLSEAIEMINCEEDKIEVNLDKVGASLEATMTFIGNASTQTANLRRQKIMEDINKNLVPFTMDISLHMCHCCSDLNL